MHPKSFKIHFYGAINKKICLLILFDDVMMIDMLLGIQNCFSKLFPNCLQLMDLDERCVIFGPKKTLVPSHFSLLSGTSKAYVGKHLSLRGGIDFEGPWRDLGGEPKESPSLRGGIRKFDQF